ncbi:MAG: hypothetical protein BGP04_24980 [Rhizobiales bacterium 62-17]|nr:MAG: hypothetical protein BGP04_24980 [Rhizobiales bacterium 62-17]
MNKSDSIFLSGRIIYKNYQKYIDDIFSIFITLQDPYYELAERLIILKSLNQQKQSFLGERDKMVFAPVVRYLENMQLDDPKSVKRGILAMPSKILMVLANPVIRQLTTSSYDEMPSGLPIATALDMLSLCDVIGFRHDMESFQRAAFLHAGGGGMNTNLPPPFLMVNRLGDLLKETGVADTFLEKDIELYQHVLAAAQVS